MSTEQLRACVELGRAIAEGRADLVQLDRRSLEVRGKAGKRGKRKRGMDEGGTAKKGRSKDGEHDAALKEEGEEPVPQAKDVKPDGEKPRQLDIRALMHGGTTREPEHSRASGLADTLYRSNSMKREDEESPLPAIIAEADDINNLIATSADLTPFRKKVLLLLTQVPPSRYTTYAAMSTFLASSPRAVGNAMRNNPFAPTVPCHRVLAANGGIGGFGGDWGPGGKHAKEKIRLLRDEGVRFDGRGKVVGRVFTEFV